MALRELLATFDIGVNGADKLQAANAGLDATKAKASAAEGALGRLLQGLSLGAVAAGVRSFVGEVTTAADDLGDTAERMGVTATELQRLQYAAERGGASAEDMGIAYKGLSNALLQAKGGSAEIASLFKKLGVESRDASGNQKGLAEILGSVGEGLKGIDPP